MRPGPLGIVAIAGVIGLLLGLLRPHSMATAPSDAATDVWQLPAPKDLLRHDSGDLAAVGAIRWDASRGSAAGVAGGEASDTPPTWHFRGVVGGATSRALIEVAGTSALRHVATGEKLPNGGVLLAISANSITVEQGSCRTRHILHQSINSTRRDCAAYPENP